MQYFTALLIPFTFATCLTEAERAGICCGLAPQHHLVISNQTGINSPVFGSWLRLASQAPTFAKPSQGGYPPITSSTSSQACPLTEMPGVADSSRDKSTGLVVLGEVCEVLEAVNALHTIARALTPCALLLLTCPVKRLFAFHFEPNAR